MMNLDETFYLILFELFQMTQIIYLWRLFSDIIIYTVWLESELSWNSFFTVT